MPNMNQFCCLLVFIPLLSGVHGQQATSNRIMQTTATCDQQYIYFRLNFEQPFRGLIYTEDAFPQCVYVNGSVNPQLTYDVPVPLSGCRTRRAPGGAWENEVIIQRNVNLLEYSDQKFLLSCTPRANDGGDGTFTVSFGGVTVNSKLSPTEVVSGIPSDSIGLSLDYQVDVQLGTGPAGPVVRRALNIGEPISYVVRVPVLPGTENRIGQCWSTDGISKIPLSDERGCSSQNNIANVWGNFRRVAGAGEMIFYNDIRAWAFPTSDKVNIFCNMHSCRDKCPIVDCQRVQKRFSGGEFQYDAVEFDTLRDLKVTSVEGSFEVAGLQQLPDTVVSGKLSSNLVTGPEARRDFLAADMEMETAGSNDICMNRLHFGLGLALMCAIILMGVGLALFVGYKRYRGLAKTGSEGESSVTTANTWNSGTLSGGRRHY